MKSNGGAVAANVKVARFGEVCGLLAPTVFIVLYAVAMSLDDEYVFGENYLSDLGVGPGAWAFNMGLVIAGALMIVFDILGLGGALGKGNLNRTGVVMVSLSGVLLISIGIFTEDSGDVHTLVSASFFLMMLATLGVLAVAFWRAKSLGKFGPLVTVVAFGFGLSLLTMQGDPLSETLAVMAILVWSYLISGAMILRASRAKNA